MRHSLPRIFVTKGNSFLVFFTFLDNVALSKDKQSLTFKAPITTAADDIHKYFFIVFSEKIRFDVSSESAAR